MEIKKLNNDLAKAVGESNIPRIKYFCVMGADPNAKVQLNGATIFMGAAYNGNKFITHALLTYGRVNLYVKRKDGKSALVIARERGNREVVEQIEAKLRFNENLRNMILDSEKRTLNMLRQRTGVLAVTIINATGDTALQLAARMYPNKITALIAKALPTEYLKVSNSEGRTLEREIEDLKPIFLSSRRDLGSRSHPIETQPGIGSHRTDRSAGRKPR